MNKKIGFTLILFLIITLLCACSTNKAENNHKYTSQELQRLCLIKIYSAKDDTLINTIEDRDILSQFNELSNKNLNFTDNEERKNALKGSTPLYVIVAYKSSAAIYNDGDLEKLYTITIYKDINTIKMEISKNAIKSFSIPSEYLTCYQNMTDEKMKFLKSLTSFSEDDKSKQ